MEEDPRFAHVASDPRFKPMPKSKKKVKIDSRFQSLFKNKHFSHRMDMDKRGRPALNQSRNNKSTMEKFYELSSNEDSDSDSKSTSDNKDEDSENDEEPASDSEVGLPQDTDANNHIKKKGKKRKQGLSNNDNIPKRKAKKIVEQESDDVVESDSEDVESDANAGSDGEGNPPMSEDDEEEDPESEDDGSDPQVDESDESEDEDLPVYSTEYDLEETDHQWNELEKDAPTTEDATHRFAVCNMDWDFVKAQDLFVLFKSFVPEGGSVKSVAIYPSEFGKERMAEEVRLGPREIREHTLKTEEEKADKKRNKNKKRDDRKEKEIKKSKEEIQTEKLREYQLKRLKYYYAVVECDSVKTADTVYTECDGREYQLSSVRLDLRFIPDDMTFDDEPREVFSEKQTVVDYQPSSFESSALCNAKVEVTWDETEFDRLSRRVATLQQKDLESIIEDNKYADIIAPPESDSEEESGRPEWLKAALAQESGDESEDELKQTKKERGVSEEEKIALYRKLLVDQAAEEQEEKEKEEGDVDKVMEWTPGITKSDVQNKLKKKKKKSEETAVVSDYLDKKKEKKKKKREMKKQKLVPEEGSAAFSDDEDLGDVDESLKEMMKGEEIFEDVVNEKKKKKKRNTEEVDEGDEKERAELELMLMDDGETKHFSKPEIVDDNESKSKKKRKSKKAMAKQKKLSQGEEVERDDFVMDVEDQRFGALYSSHHFHIDPTAPQFKKTKNMMRLVDEQIKRKKSAKKSLQNGENGGSVKSSKSVSQSLVENLKKKMKKT